MRELADSAAWIAGWRQFFWVPLEQEMATNGEIDDRLKQLAIAAKNHPPKTVERQKAVAKLYMEIERYKIIKCPKNPNFSPEIYQEICTETKQDLMLRICKEVQNYRPEKDVSQWVNFLMTKCF